MIFLGEGIGVKITKAEISISVANMVFASILNQSKILILNLFLLIIGCHNVDYFPQYYDEELSDYEYIPLQENYAKVIFGDIEQLKNYIKNGYVVLGKSVYVGKNKNICPQILLEEFARDNDASIAFSIVQKIGSYQETILHPGHSYTSGNYTYGGWTNNDYFSSSTTYTPAYLEKYKVDVYRQETYYLAPRRM